VKVNDNLIPPFWLSDQDDDQKQRFYIHLLAPTSQAVSTEALAYLEKESVRTEPFVKKGDYWFECEINVIPAKAWQLFQQLISIGGEHGFDVAVVPVEHQAVKLLVCDMDSTIVASETLDDIAEKIGIEAEVKAITAKAMRGEMDFKQALSQRVALLADKPASLLDDVAASIVLNEGAQELLDTARKNNIRTVLVSGGFDPIVGSVANKLQFDRYECNRMEIKNGLLTGHVIEPIVDSDTKLNVLHEECKRLGITSRQACCIGDGANDLPMLQAAGFGISYYGKPLLRDSLPYQINQTDLASVLAMTGIV
jgi:phosphoserine phosphatase